MTCKRRLFALTLALPVLAMAACSPGNGTNTASEPVAAETLSEQELEISVSYDASGYYLPNSAITAGGWTVNHLFIGHSTDFELWREAGATPVEIPVWLSLDPVDGETAVNELGQTYFVGNRRIRPSSFTLTDGAFEFRARDETLGQVIISGRIQPEYLHVPGETPHDNAAALTVGVEMDQERFRNTSFMHWLGD